jgi:hypothetical protein
MSREAAILDASSARNTDTYLALLNRLFLLNQAVGKPIDRSKRLVWPRPHPTSGRAIDPIEISRDKLVYCQQQQQQHNNKGKMLHFNCSRSHDDWGEALDPVRTGQHFKDLEHLK